MTPREIMRRNELLCDRASGELSGDEERELAALLRLGPVDELSFELAAAAVAVATVPDLAPSTALLERLQRDAASFSAASIPTPAAPARRRGWLPVTVAVGGWAAAAALAVVLATLPARAPRVDPVAVASTAPVAASSTPAQPPPSLTEERAALLAEGAAVVHVDWGQTKDAAARGVTGDVVWSARTQRGFMRFQGLAINDPKQLQYQLWIFDENQDARYPIDGGVFDIDRATGDVVVAIVPKISVRHATLFAVTIEQPGGVVVSSRKRLVLAAKPAG